MNRWKILARHKWVFGCLITESHNEFKSLDGPCGAYRRFTATIDGWRGFKIYEGFCFEGMADIIEARVRRIMERIKEGDDSVFKENITLSPYGNHLCNI
jgi:hypothetical protein